MRTRMSIILLAILLDGCTMLSSSPPNPPTTLITTSSIHLADIPTTASGPTPSLEGGGYRGCETLSHPLFPQLRLYPDHRDLIHTGTPTERTMLRHTTFRSSASTTDLIAWYREQALADAWTETHVIVPISQYLYIANGMCGPTFVMTIEITSDVYGSRVNITREIVGPFFSMDWPSE